MGIDGQLSMIKVMLVRCIVEKALMHIEKKIFKLGYAISNVYK